MLKRDYVKLKMYKPNTKEINKFYDLYILKKL